MESGGLRGGRSSRRCGSGRSSTAGHLGRNIAILVLGSTPQSHLGDVFVTPGSCPLGGVLCGGAADKVVGGGLLLGQ